METDVVSRDPYTSPMDDEDGRAAEKGFSRR